MYMNIAPPTSLCTSPPTGVGTVARKAQRLASELAKDAACKGISIGEFLIQCVQILRDTLLQGRPAWRNGSVRITPISAASLPVPVALFHTVPETTPVNLLVPELAVELSEVRQLLDELPDLGEETPRAAAALIGIHQLLQQLDTDGLRAALDDQTGLRIEICALPSS